jgi:aminoglycoside 6-adenylyltransferase
LTYERIIGPFLIWAKTQQDLRAAIILGSRATVDPPADAFSDLDLTLITTDPDRYLRDAGWLELSFSYGTRPFALEEDPGNRRALVC